MKRLVLLYDEHLPYAGTRPSADQLKRVGCSFDVVDADTLSAALADESVECFVTLHGSFFPKSAWTAIRAFLQRGNGLITVGGAPFRQPVIRMRGSWTVEPVQTAYLQELRIHEALPVNGSRAALLRHNPDLPVLAAEEHIFSLTDTFGLVLHATTTTDYPHESGSAGTMDVQIHSLLVGVSVDDREVTAPVVLLEYLRGEYAGARWICVNQTVDARFWFGGGCAALERWADFCARGVTEIRIQPGYAAYEVGEAPFLRVQTQRLSRARRVSSDAEAPATEPAAGGQAASLRIRVQGRAEGSPDRVWEDSLTVWPSPHLELHTVTLPFTVQPGLYNVVCEVRWVCGETRTLRQGFWGVDRPLLEAGEPLDCDRDYFRQAGRPFPVVGMTYMASDVARKFVFLPNAAVWDQDMAHMRQIGINLIRTGIWTGWRHVMFEDGHPSEEIMRAIDAFFLTAKRHGLEVVFTFFAFTPPLWGGVNPYLDPRSLAAQKRFVSAVVSRHRTSSHVNWDLINEPSLFDPARIFQGPRSLHDPYEKAAWIVWLKARHKTLETLQRRWNATPAELPDWADAPLPEPHDINFEVTDMGSGKRGVRWLDYCLFTMDMLNRWTRDLSAAIRAVGSTGLITVGQDEALVRQRPSPSFYAESVDYTTVHSWWQNDHLVWNGVFSKTPDRPNLVQETGVMYLECPNGQARRSEEELRDMLERKYAYAFATGGAGAVQWLWNTNFYMDNVNESNIGALRADGTQKPEADVSRDFGRFFETVRDLFEGRRLEDVAVVFPYSNDFSNRPMAFEATTRLARVLAYDLKCAFRSVGEYHVHQLKAVPCVIVPSAHNLSDAAREALFAAVRNGGGTLVWTGPLSIDAYWQPSEACPPELSRFASRSVRREETVEIEERVWAAPFGGSMQDRAKAGDGEGNETVRIREIALGRGTIIWCPLPLELCESSDTLAAFYEYALSRVGVAPELEWMRGGDLRGVFGRKLQFANGDLFVFVSEAACAGALSVRNPRTDCAYEFIVEPGRAALFATDPDGEIIAVYRPAEIRVTMTRCAPLQVAQTE